MCFLKAMRSHSSQKQNPETQVSSLPGVTSCVQLPRLTGCYENLSHKTKRPSTPTITVYLRAYRGLPGAPGIYLLASFPTHTRPLLSYSNTSTLTLGTLFPSFNHLKFSSCIYSLHILGQMPPCTSSTPQIPDTNKIKPFQVSLPLLPFL